MLCLIVASDYSTRPFHPTVTPDRCVRPLTQIYPAAENLLSLRATATWLLNFTMTKFATHSTYHNSVVWGRDSAVAGRDITSKYYELIQVRRLQRTATSLTVTSLTVTSLTLPR